MSGAFNLLRFAREVLERKRSPGVDWGSHLFQLFQAMAPRKRSRQDSAASSSAPAVPTSRIDETHAAQLARHLAGLRKLRRFTDLKV